MANGTTPGTAAANGPLWGARADDWAGIQEGQCRPVYDAALARAGVGPGTRYLDVGCGAGMAARMAADRGALVSGLDASAPLLAVARTRLPDADLRQGDIEALPFPDHAFDVVTGFNAFQFAGAPGVALAEARRVAVPGGTVVVMTWGDPAGMEAATIVGSLRTLLPPPPPGAPGPFALSDETALRAFATAAGLEPGEVLDVPAPFVYPDLATALRGLGSSGVAARAMAQAGAEAVDRAHAEALAPFCQPDGRVVVRATFRCLLARA